MSDKIRIAVVIPAGPRDDVIDTLHSVVRYTDSSRVILVIDDTRTLSGDYDLISRLSADISIIPAPPKAPGGYGGLWVKLAKGYSWVLDRFQPRTILRLDADAVMLGHGLEDAAEEMFSQNPKVGLLGSYRFRPDGELRDFAPAARDLRFYAGVGGLLHPRCCIGLRQYLRLARANGYVDGEHAQGGAYIHSFESAYWMYQNGWFDQAWFAGINTGEDIIMALLTKAAGYDIADFGGPSDPLALEWRGLPAGPCELLAKGKLVTHSVRFWHQMTEQQIRSIFADARLSLK
jgi:hypothetical protein